MTNEEFQQEINKNIKLAFDNRESFTERFSLGKFDTLTSFYMGDMYHHAEFLCEKSLKFESLAVQWEDFEDWKQSLNKDDSNE